MYVAPIPLHLLPHTVELYRLKSDDRWDNEYSDKPIRVDNVRFEYSTKLIKDKTGSEIQLKGMLYYDNVNSKPKDTIFNVSDKIKFNENEYTIMFIQPILAIKPHHIEIGLI